MVQYTEPSIADLLRNPLRLRHVLVDDPRHVARKQECIHSLPCLTVGLGWSLTADLDWQNSKLILVRMFELDISVKPCASILSIIPGAEGEQGFGRVKEVHRFAAEMGIGPHHLNGHRSVTEQFFDLTDVIHIGLNVASSRDQQSIPLTLWLWPR